MDNINLELNSVFKRIIKKQNLPKNLLDNLNEKINNKDPNKNTEEQEIEIYNKSKGLLNNTDGYNCNICKNKGHYLYLNNGYQEAKICECMKVRKSIRRLKRSGLKNFIKDYTLDKYKADEQWQKDIKLKAIKYISDMDNKWWYIGGQSGGGKTHICTAICGELLKMGNSVQYMLWKEESTILKACINDEKVYTEKINRLKNVDILYIDDLFKPIKTQNEALAMPTIADINLVFEILSARIKLNLKTIISSERNISELLDIDEAIAGRIIEKAGKEYILYIDKGLERNYRLKNI